MIFRDFWLSNISASLPAYKAILFDVDGTVVSGRNPMPGAEKTLRWLREINTPFLFLTNDSHHTPEQKASLIRRAGVTVEPDEIISSGHVLTDFVRENSLPGAKAFIMGEVGDPCFAEAAGLIPCRDIDDIDSCELVIAGDGKFDWRTTFQAVLNYFVRHKDRRLIVPNPDSYWLYSNTGKIGVGAGAQARFIAGLLKEMQINIEVVYLGKPYEAVFKCARRYLQEKFAVNYLQPHEIIMLGDALFSDVAGARNAGLTPALVMTGVTSPEILAAVPEKDRPELIFDAVGHADNDLQSAGE